MFLKGSNDFIARRCKRYINIGYNKLLKFKIFNSVRVSTFSGDSL